MRSANGLQYCDGMEYIASVPKGETIVSMVVFGEKLYVSTDKDIYVLADDRRLEKFVSKAVTDLPD